MRNAVFFVLALGGNFVIDDIKAMYEDDLSLFQVVIGEESSEAKPISWATIFQEMHKQK